MKTAVVLFNLGGPDSLKNVRPFLFNLFADPAILNLPFFVRYPLAALISTLRNKKAGTIYAALGGASPLLSKTEEQVRALDQALGQEFKVFVSMRYWHPRAEKAVRELRDWGAERIVLLPMYPQYSFSTTASSLADFEKALARAGLKLPVKTIRDYPALEGFVKALASLIRSEYERLSRAALEKNLLPPRLLLSAHGLPVKNIEAGDPYAAHCAQSAAAVVKELNTPGLDWKLCYQSRVGPLEWLKPYTEDEISRAGEERRPLLIAPLAFTADNSETLYEIDQLYREQALSGGVPLFASTPCVGTHPDFIAGLAGLVRGALG
jgi:ferrochelatase